MIGGAVLVWYLWPRSAAMISSCARPVRILDLASAFAAKGIDSSRSSMDHGRSMKRCTIRAPLLPPVVGELLPESESRFFERLSGKPVHLFPGWARRCHWLDRGRTLTMILLMNKSPINHRMHLNRSSLASLSNLTQSFLMPCSAIMSLHESPIYRPE